MRLPELIRYLPALALLACIPADAAPRAPATWKADHHVHVGSVDVCRRFGECLESNTPPAVYAVDAIRALDAAGVARGVVLSDAYLYGVESLHLTPAEVVRFTRLENEFTAAEVARYPERLVGFLAVDPLDPSALPELEHWRGSRVLRGLKLHLTADGVDLKRPGDLSKVQAVVAAAAAQGLPMVIHIGGGGFGPGEAALFIDSVLPRAGTSWVQIAHAAGGLPVVGDAHARILALFGDHIQRHDPATERLLFDLSYVPGPGEDAAAARQLLTEIRRIGIDRFLFASDFSVQTPLESVARLRTLGLSEAEWARVAAACAPWAC